MPKSLSVWHWVGWVDNATSADCIMAAYSQAQVARAVGVKSPARLWNLGVTANAEEVAQALFEPGVVFWHPTSERNMRPTDVPFRWRRNLPRRGQPARG